MKDEDTNRDPLDTASARFRLFQRTIKVIGNSELQQLQPYLQARIEETLESAIAAGTVDDKGQFLQHGTQSPQKIGWLTLREQAGRLSRSRPR